MPDAIMHARVMDPAVSTVCARVMTIGVWVWPTTHVTARTESAPSNLRGLTRPTRTAIITNTLNAPTEESVTEQPVIANASLATKARVASALPVLTIAQVTASVRTSKTFLSKQLRSITLFHIMGVVPQLKGLPLVVRRVVLGIS